ncbi:MAG: helix-turn-helix transcriptional regulator [Oscillospiraceae bacterium]|nr:helix-turn-helix transcriptional regulator [Oscillospiraceae bacterium]
MNWIQCLTEAIRYIEKHLTVAINVDEVSNKAYSSSSHFQLVFHLVTGITVGEYIRNRRLSMAAYDLLHPDCRIIDVAMRYQYDTQESFSKAFTRFHGVSPSKARRNNIRFFHPLSIDITIQGGFEMSRKLIDEFYWSNISETANEKTGAERYKDITAWALKARGKNPSVFDALTEWILDDTQWTDAKLAENEQILMQGVLARFKEQNAKLRSYLQELEPSGVVNAAVFKALDRFDEELCGETHNEYLRETIAKLHTDFTIMRERGVRELIAGDKTGPAGTDTINIFGYINILEGCDSGVQWALFMPDMVKQQQQGFQVEEFEYRTFPAMRFVGLTFIHDMDDAACEARHGDASRTLDAMTEYKSDFDYDLFFMHHNGGGVDTSPWCGFFGRFMKAGTPVPEGYVSFDFVPQRTGEAGPPFISQAAFAVFTGDAEAMHKREGFDSDAMYDVTRNIILGQGMNIPYPDKYWTAEIHLDGHDKPSTGYLFSVEM